MKKVCVFVYMFYACMPKNLAMWSFDQIIKNMQGMLNLAMWSFDRIIKHMQGMFAT